MVSNRYALVETLFSNNLGSLHRAHDRYPLFGQVDVLLHFLPGHAFKAVSMSTLLDRLQAKCQQIDLPLLEVLDGGSAGEEVYFVMRLPDSWTLSVLPVVRGKPTRLHLQAQAITADLVTQGLVREGLEPQLFLVSPEGQLHLLGTALMPELQLMQLESQTLLTFNKVLGNHSTRLFPLLLLCSTGALAAAGYGLYQGRNKPEPVVMLPTAIPAISVRDAGYMDRPQETSRVVANAASSSDKRELLVEAPPADRSASLGSKGQARALVSVPEETNKASVSVLPMNPALPPSVESIAPKQPPTISPAAAREIKTLLPRIRQAIDNNHLQAALYSLRMLQRRQPDHPQLSVLAEEITAGYRANAADDGSGLFERMADGLENEFGLKALVAGK